MNLPEIILDNLKSQIITYTIINGDNIFTIYGSDKITEAEIVELLLADEQFIRYYLSGRSYYSENNTICFGVPRRVLMKEIMFALQILGYPKRPVLYRQRLIDGFNYNYDFSVMNFDREILKFNIKPYLENWNNPPPLSEWEKGLKIPRYRYSEFYEILKYPTHGYKADYSQGFCHHFLTRPDNRYEPPDYYRDMYPEEEGILTKIKKLLN